MSHLSSTLEKEDLDTLIEAMNDWEANGNHEFYVMSLVKSIPMPADDHESHDYIQSLKNHFKEREKEIRANREVRQERAIFLKAKLMLLKRDWAVSKLFETARTGAETASEQSAPVEEVTAKASNEPVLTAEQKNALELAEDFIKDLGVWSHYEEFLAERKNA